MSTTNPKYKDNLIMKLSFEFAVALLRFTEILNAQKKFVIANQLTRSGTSIGANIREAQNAESKADFIHKVKISAKEADETEYWLLLCKELKYSEGTEILLMQLESIQKVLNKIISSSKINLKSLANQPIR